MSLAPRDRLIGETVETADRLADDDARAVDVSADDAAPGRARRQRKARAKRKERRKPPSTFEEASEITARKGTISRPKLGRSRRGWYAPQHRGAPSTTRQVEILCTAVIAPPTDDEGLIVGIDGLSQAPVAHDPFTAYAKRIISSPNVVVLGDVGGGKSSLLKTVYALRPLVIANRRVVVMDRKDRAGEGEYAELTRRFGAEPLRFNLDGGGTRLNLLDPVILAGTGASGQLRLLAAVTELQQDGQPLSQWEREAMRVAYAAAQRSAEDLGRVPVLEDVTSRLGHVPDSYSDLRDGARDRLHEAGVSVKFMLNALREELGELFDGETSSNVQLNQRLTTFDISQLPEASPAVSMVVTTANVWLMGTLRKQRGLQTTFLAEEGWYLVSGPGGRVLKSNTKLSRGLGLSNVIALHKIADVPATSPAIAVIQEAQTVHLFAQAREPDVRACVEMFSLNAGSATTLATLPVGHHLLKIGSRPEIYVRHPRSNIEVQLTNTDEGMLGA